MVTVDNPMERIMANFRTALEPIVGEGNCGSDYNMSSSATMYAKLTQLGQPTLTTDISGNEVATNLSVQTESFASGTLAITNVYTVDQAIHECMVGIGFRCTYGPELIKNTDSRIARLVRRYSRVYTGQLLGESEE